MGVMVLAWFGAVEPARVNVADRTLEKVGAWKVSFRRMRWWTTWYRWRNISVLCEASGKRDGLEVDLAI
jgi:hypothetical protein